MNRGPWIAGIIAAFFTMSGAIAGERLTSEEVRKLLVGNTEHGKYEYMDELVDYWEFNREDGKIKGRNGGKYSGKYKIKEDGCFYVTYYSDDESSGCYYYEHITGNKYHVTGPNGWSSDVTVSEGDSKNLD